MKRSAFVSSMSILLALAGPASAQDLPPGHPPTEVPAPEGELPPGHPPTDAPAPEGELPPDHPPTEAPPEVGPAEAPHGDAPHGDMGTPHGGGSDPAMDATLERAFREPRVASADPNPSIPAGQIRIRVVDENGAPLPNQEIQLGIMRQGGDRERTPGRTDESGVFTYTELPTGSGQAYRVNVPRDGATYSSTPFQLPTAIGYDVRVQTQQTVRSDRSLLLVLGQTMVELRDERLHIIQQVRLSNLGAATYLFPEGGTRIELPEGYISFQTQPVMTDQRVVELAGEGLRIEGSLPTGQVTLAWAFDLPVTGSEMDIEIPNPFRTFQYRVLSTAPPGLSMEVEDMPDPVRFEDQGQPLLGTEIQRSPEQPAVAAIHIRLRGIPGPSPARWVAVSIAGLLIALGAMMAGRRGVNDGGAAQRQRRREELLAEAAGLEAELAAGDIGPEHRQSRRAAIVRELAVLLYQDQRAGTTTPIKSPPTKARATAGGEAGPRNGDAPPPKQRASKAKSGARSSTS